MSFPPKEEPLPAAPARSLRYKRPLDLAILIAAHVALLPIWALLWAVVPLLVWLEDRGPVFFVQERVGKDGGTFGLIKFRSMRVRKEGEDWAGDTKANDSRLTRVGRVLRRTALDELPQVINLWKGDLSFVGPRALPVGMHEGYVADEPDFVLRLAVRPGLTGLAQLQLARHASARERLDYDSRYIRSASLLLDIKLILLSVLYTLTGRWGTGRRAVPTNRD